MSVTDEYENDITMEHIKQIEVTSETITTPSTTTTNIRDTVIEHILYSAPSTDKPAIPPPNTLKPMNVSSEMTSLKPITSTEKLLTTLAPTTEKMVISSTSATIKRAEVTTPVPKPLEDEDYSFESMFSFLFNGDTPEQSSSSSSLPSSTNKMESETRIEHRTDDEIDDKVHLDDAKHGQADFTSLPKQQQKPSLNPGDTEQHADPKYHQNTNQYFGINQHLEDKHNKVEPQEANKPLESKPNTETKQYVNDKLNSETKHHVDTKPPHTGTNQHVDVKSHQEIKQHVDVKTHQEIKTDTIPSGTKQQAEVKTHFDVKENAQAISPFDLKLYDDVKPSYHGLSNHQTEVKSHFSVRDQPELKIHQDSKFQSDSKIYSDIKHQSEINKHFDVKEHVEVNPYFDFKQQTEVKHHPDFKQHADVGLQSEFKQPADVKPNIRTTPLKTKVDTDFNLLASMLKISGCNIYGRMYRVGKIISELSNPCLECMCTEIGVHCNQLKC